MEMNVVQHETRKVLEEALNRVKHFISGAETAVPVSPSFKEDFLPIK